MGKIGPNAVSRVLLSCNITELPGSTRYPRGLKTLRKTGQAKDIRAMHPSPARQALIVNRRDE